MNRDEAIVLARKHVNADTPMFPLPSYMPVPEPIIAAIMEAGATQQALVEALGQRVIRLQEDAATPRGVTTSGTTFQLTTETAVPREPIEAPSPAAPLGSEDAELCKQLREGQQFLQGWSSLTKHGSAATACGKAADRIEALSAQVAAGEADRRDAERYRWLISVGASRLSQAGNEAWDKFMICDIAKTDIDTAIDAAIATQGGSVTVSLSGLELLRASAKRGDRGYIFYAPRRVTSPALEKFRAALQSLLDNKYVIWHDVSGEQETQWLYAPTAVARAYIKRLVP